MEEIRAETGIIAPQFVVEIFAQQLLELEQPASGGCFLLSKHYGMVGYCTHKSRPQQHQNDKPNVCTDST